MRIDEIGFDQAWAKTHTKVQFVEEFMPHDHIYAGLKKADKVVALENAWKKLKGDEPVQISGSTPANVVAIKEDKAGK